MTVDRYRLWLRLRIVKGMSNTAFLKLLNAFGSPDAILGVGEQNIRNVLGPKSKLPAAILQAGDLDEELAKELDEIEQVGCHLVSIEDEEYPELLKNAATPPPLLYVKGTLKPEDKQSLAIVGSRSSTQYGKEVALNFAETLTRKGITIISGFADGIDSTAHKAALDCGGRTIAVLGNGLSKCFPASNKKLGEEITESGALVSTFPMQTKPERFNFPERNYYLAAMAPAVLVIEAAKRSGTLITASCALDEGRIVFAVPGDIFRTNSRGVNNLIRQGAIAATSPSDIIEDLKAQFPEWEEEAETECDEDKKDETALKGLSDEEKEILDLVGHHSRSLEQICEFFEERGHSFGDVTLWLLNLQMNNLIKQLPGNSYIRTKL